MIVQLVVEGMEPDMVAAERGVSRHDLVEDLRRAVGAAAGQYELLAHDYLNERPALSRPSALEGKRG